MSGIQERTAATFMKQNEALQAEANQLRAENEALKNKAAGLGLSKMILSGCVDQSIGKVAMLKSVWCEVHDDEPLENQPCPCCAAVQIAGITRQRDEAQARCAVEARALESVRKTGEEFMLRMWAAEKARDEAVKHYHAAIELADVQKYARLLDERDALAGKLEEAQNDAQANWKSFKRTVEELHAEKVQNAAMREALKDAMSALRYIRQTNGRLDGVGWERVEQSALAALNPTA